MRYLKPGFPALLLLILFFPFVSSCSEDSSKARKSTLTLAAYTTPREAYGLELIPLFARKWKERTGVELSVNESYQGSGAQARAIIGGFEADVAALSLSPDMEKLQAAGLVDPGWNTGPQGGMATRSVAVVCVRKGNPKNIRGWADLARPDVEVLTPNPKTSGGAMWNILALYGAALRGHVPGVEKGDRRGAEKFLSAVLGRVKIMDAGARESILTFERGVGDAAITYENEVLAAVKAGKSHEYVVPDSTILIENPVAVVSANAKKAGNLEVAAAFVEFLSTAEAQRIFAAHGYRPVNGQVAAEVSGRFATPADLFSIGDLGGWQSAVKEVFAPGGVFDRALSEKRR